MKTKSPEWLIQQSLLKLLRSRDWFVIVCHASSIFKGVPDLYACHKEYGIRWIEVKVKGQYRFTKDQLKTFPKLHSNGAPIHILCGDTEEEYKKLFHATGNFPEFLRPFEKKAINTSIGGDDDWDRELVLGTPI